MSEVVFKNVYKIFPGDGGKEVTAVRDFNLEVRDREFIVLVGPSGCGKSTTLRMLAGLEEISRGEISINGRRMNDVPPKDRDIAMVFQNYALYPHMSVYDNMAFGLKLRKMPREEIRRQVHEAAAILGLDELLRRKPKALSGGQRQRVALGRAIVRHPAVFLFDEPLSNLDAKMRVQMRAEIIRLHQRLQTTMIYVTHDQVEAMTMGTRIVVMDAVPNPRTGFKDGVIQQIDTPLNLYDRPANLFVAGFLGSPPMNFLGGRLRSAGGRLYFEESGSGRIRLDVSGHPGVSMPEGGEIILGVRPENCEVAADSTNAADDVFELGVDFIETLGAETLFHLQTGAHTLICRSHLRLVSSDGSRSIRVRLDPRCLHFFDPHTGDRLAGK